MKRTMALAIGAALLIGCGARDYDYRLERTLDQMKYTKRLDDNLTDPVKGVLEQRKIYVRPPKAMAGPTQTFMMAAVEPGRFDVEVSFEEPEKQSLHLLARVKEPKSTPKKGAPQAEPPPRGDFATDVVELVKNAYGADLNVADFKEETKRNNTFKHKQLDLQAKYVQIYLYGGKNNPYEVAMIFDYPKTERNAVDPKIGLCLESFAVGERARRAFAGGEAEETAEEAADESSQPVAF